MLGGGEERGGGGGGGDDDGRGEKLLYVRKMSKRTLGHGVVEIFDSLASSPTGGGVIARGLRDDGSGGRPLVVHRTKWGKKISERDPTTKSTIRDECNLTLENLCSGGRRDLRGTRARAPSRSREN